MLRILIELLLLLLLVSSEHRSLKKQVMEDMSHSCTINKTPGKSDFMSRCRIWLNALSTSEDIDRL